MDKRNWIIGGIGFGITLLGAILAGIGPIYSNPTVERPWTQQTFTMTPFGYAFMIVGTLIMVYALVMILRSAGESAPKESKPVPVQEVKPVAPQPAATYSGGRVIQPEASAPTAPRPVAPTPPPASVAPNPFASTVQDRPYYTSDNPVAPPRI